MSTRKKTRSVSQADSKQAERIKLMQKQITNYSVLLKTIIQSHESGKESIEDNPSSAYSRGYFNAIEYIRSVAEDRKPQYAQMVPEKSYVDEASSCQSDARLTTDALVDKLLSGMTNREAEFPQLLEKLMDKIMWKLTHDAELTHERHITSRDRLEHALKIIGGAHSKANSRDNSGR